MIVAAEELHEGDLIHFKSGTRALQPEYEDMYIVACPPQDKNPAEVAILLLEMWEETPEVVVVLRREKVEIIRVYS